MLKIQHSSTAEYLHRAWGCCGWRGCVTLPWGIAMGHSITMEHRHGAQHCREPGAVDGRLCRERSLSCCGCVQGDGDSVGAEGSRAGTRLISGFAPDERTDWNINTKLTGINAFFWECLQILGFRCVPMCTFHLFHLTSFPSHLIVASARHQSSTKQAVHGCRKRAAMCHEPTCSRAMEPSDGASLCHHL